jgi:glyoxylase-like metal-dependent hydrolase (beta-lactamase superfamily II)
MVEIVKGLVHRVEGVNANSYIVLESDGSLTLIDTGMSPDGKRILDYIRTTLSKQPSDLKTIVITHAHFDHVRGALAIKKAATGARVAIHEADSDYLSGKKNLPPPGGILGFFFRIFGGFARPLSIEADTKLKENDQVGEGLTVIHTPGHTPGSISLYNPEMKLIFVGDAIINRGGRLSGSPSSIMLRNTADRREAEASIEKLANFDFEILLSGHGEPIKSDGSKKVKDLSKSLL